MSPGTIPFEGPRRPARRLLFPWFTLGLGGAILGASYLTGANRNLLYLSMLFSMTVVLSLLVRRWWAVALGLGACAYLAWVPATVADLGTLYPAPRDRPGAENLWVSRIGEGETWTYQFALTGREGSAKGPGLNGYLYVDGRNLSGLVVCVQGKTLEGSAFCTKKNGLDHLEIPLGIVAANALTVSLRGMPHTAPKIFHGPEVHGFDVYGDAVWLEFARDEDRMIYEAKRGVAPSAPR